MENSICFCQLYIWFHTVKVQEYKGSWSADHSARSGPKQALLKTKTWENSGLQPIFNLNFSLEFMLNMILFVNEIHERSLRSGIAPWHYIWVGLFFHQIWIEKVTFNSKHPLGCISFFGSELLQYINHRQFITLGFLPWNGTLHCCSCLFYLLHVASIYLIPGVIQSVVYVVAPSDFRVMPLTYYPGNIHASPEAYSVLNRSSLEPWASL